MRVAFRVDASARIGIGHVMRCLALADALYRCGAECVFVHRRHPGHMAATIRGRGYAVHELPEPTSERREKKKPDYGAWLGVSVQQDAHETAAILNDHAMDWLVVDHYALDAAWEQALSPTVRAIAVLDDLANRRHDCDLLVDQNYFPEPVARYDGMVPSRSRCLCGPRYALLRSEYADARRLIGPRRGPVSRVLVFYGGADAGNETGRALRVLSRTEFAHLAVDVVIGANNPEREVLTRQAAERPLTTVHGPREHLVDLMIEADLAIGAGGATTWERCALGLPGIVTAVAANQKPFNEALAAEGLVRYLGHSPDATDLTVAAALREVIARPEVLAEQARRAWHVADGLGADRVAELMHPAPPAALTLRPARSSDKSLWFEWANHLETGRSVDHPDPVSHAPHLEGIEERITDPDTWVWVLVTPRGLPIGQAQVELEGADGVLSYSIDPAFGNRELKARILELVAESWAQSVKEIELHQQKALQAEAPAVAFLKSAAADDMELSMSAEALSLTVLSDPGSWINSWVPTLLNHWLRQGHRVRWVDDPALMTPGDLCFLLGCGQLLSAEQLKLHRHNLVVHASDLPRGRGWSPLAWQILEGANRIPVTLIEAAEKVDSGDIYLQDWLELEGHELIGDLRTQVGDAACSLCRRFVEEYPRIAENGRAQTGVPAYYPRRGPMDSELDPYRTIAEQFNVLRVVDNCRYPAFFDLRGHRYYLRIDHAEEPSE